MYVFVFNGKSLPVAFNEEENMNYYKQYKDGNIDAREILIKHNLRLILTVIQRNFGNIQYDLEELFSVGIVGLIKGIDSYDISKNTKISFYIAKCIRYEIFMFLRKNYEKGDISLDSVVLEDGLDIVTYREVLVSNEITLEEQFIEKDTNEFNKKIINDVLNILSERDRKIVMLYFGFIDGKLYKQREIAEIIGIGRAGVSRVLISSLEKIKARLLFEDRYFDVARGNVLNRKLVN